MFTVRCYQVQSCDVNQCNGGVVFLFWPPLTWTRKISNLLNRICKIIPDLMYFLFLQPYLSSGHTPPTWTSNLHYPYQSVTSSALSSLHLIRGCHIHRLSPSIYLSVTFILSVTTLSFQLFLSALRVLRWNWQCRNILTRVNRKRGKTTDSSLIRHMVPLLCSYLPSFLL